MAARRPEIGSRDFSRTKAVRPARVPEAPRMEGREKLQAEAIPPPRATAQPMGSVKRRGGWEVRQDSEVESALPSRIYHGRRARINPARKARFGGSARPGG